MACDEALRRVAQLEEESRPKNGLSQDVEHERRSTNTVLESQGSIRNISVPVYIYDSVIAWDSPTLTLTLLRELVFSLVIVTSLRLQVGWYQ